jgi:hypothetical protein
LAFGDKDLDIFFGDGTAVTMLDGSIVMAHFDVPEKVDSFPGMGRVAAGAITGDPHITFSTAKKPKSFVDGARLSIGAKQYKVRECYQEQDGLVSVARLSEV